MDLAATDATADFDSSQGTPHMSARYISLAALFATATAGSLEAQSQCVGCRETFAGAIGVGMAVMPRYTGSDEYRFLPIPVVQLEYKGRLFLGSSQSGVGAGLGAYVIHTASLSWDVGLSGAESRPESRGDALAGMGRRDAASFATTGVTYRLGSVVANAGAAIGLSNEVGSYGAVGISTERRIARRWVGGLSTGATFADAKNMGFEFGVTSSQAAARQALVASGDPRLEGISVASFKPDAGLKELRGAVSLSFLLTERTRLMAFAQNAQLSAEAGRSPLVRSRNSSVAGFAIMRAF